MRRYEATFQDPVEGIPVTKTVVCKGVDYWPKRGFWELRFQDPQPGENGEAIAFLHIRKTDFISLIGFELGDA